MGTIIHIDGFNLHYRALRNTPYHWLDPDRLAQSLHPKDKFVRICYYTAWIAARPWPPVSSP